MKKIVVAFFVVGAIAIFAFAGLGVAGGSEAVDQDFMRLHIRANSNSTIDQDVKYLVKQEIVNELTPIFVDVTTKSEAMDKLAANLAKIESVANACLAKNGFSYTARAAIKSEHFPTRAYSLEHGTDVVLPEGVYDALIVELGTGTGDNWWCVVYPPLCFLENNIGGSEGVKYRSKIYELIKNI